MLIRRVWLCIAVILVLAAQGGWAKADHPRQGLMWNRTGLPAVFPLQVKTRVGQDYVLLLSDAQTGADVLAAYIVGGRFFRVLVPPGTFTVRFASGVTWQGEESMFGRHGETQVIEMPDPLTFEVVGLRVKAGHLIDLRQAAPGEAAQLGHGPVRICQRTALLPYEWLAFSLDEIGFATTFLGQRGRYFEVHARYC